VATGSNRFLPVGVGLRVIILVGVIVIADRPRVASVPVHAVILAALFRTFRVAGLSAFWVAGLGALQVAGLDH